MHNKHMTKNSKPSKKRVYFPSKLNKKFPEKTYKIHPVERSNLLNMYHERKSKKDIFVQKTNLFLKKIFSHSAGGATYN